MTLRNVMAVLLAVLLAVCLSVGITTSFAQASNLLADEAAEPAFTYYLGTEATPDDADTSKVIGIKDMGEGWLTAVAKATELASDRTAENKLVQIILAGDWLSEETGFGTDKRAFSNGALYVPAAADVRIDLAGHIVKRQLSDIVQSGSVMALAGTVEIVDSAPEAEHSAVDAQLYSYGGKAVTGGIITGGKSYYGGAIYSSGNVTLSGGTLYGNEAAEVGGAVFVYSNSKKFTVNGGQIIGNTARVVTYKEIVGDDGKTEEKSTRGVGGAIGALPADNQQKARAIIEINSGNMSYNSAANGGAIYANQASVIGKGGVLSHNSATGVGGAICVDTYASLTLSNTVISENEATDGGAISMASDKEIAVNESEIKENSAAGNGGALHMLGGTAVFTNVKINGNTSMRFGGALYTANSEPNLTVVGGEIKENNAAKRGAALYSYSGKTVLKDVQNISGNGIDGIFVGNGTVEVEGVKIFDNDGYDVRVNATTKATFQVKGNVEINHVYLGRDEESQIFKTITVAGEIAEGSKIHVDCTDSGVVIATQYKEHNSAEGYAINPSKFFEVEGGNEVILLKDGSVKTYEKKVEWSIGYNGSSETEAVSDYGVAFVYDPDKKVSALTLKVGDNPNDTINFMQNGDEIKNVNREEKEVISWTRTEKLNGDDVVFDIYIKPIEIAEENITINFSSANIADGYHTVSFTGLKQEPLFDVQWNINENAGDTLIYNTDYTREYENNIFAGTARVVVNLCGNYNGSAYKEFVIKKDENYHYAVTWEYNTGSKENPVWRSGQDGVTYEPISNRNFVYDGSDQSENVRAKLTLVNAAGNSVAGFEEHVYATVHRKYKEDSGSLTLKFIVGGNDDGVKFKDADTYTITIVGEGSASFNANSTAVQATIKPVALNIDAELLEKQENLWQLEFGNDRVDLLDFDNANFIGKDSFSDVNAKKAFAYYRGDGNMLRLVLNKELMIKDSSGNETAKLEVYINGGEANYSNNEVTNARYGIVNTYNVSVTLRFGKNYTGEDIVLSKTVYVVTAANKIVDGNAQTKNELTWNYGQIGFSSEYAFRPQKGGVAVYTFVQGIDEIDKFAVEFTEEGPVFYEYDENVDGEILLAVQSARISSLYEYARGLSAGEYKLRVYAPKYVAADEFETVYAEVNFEVDLKVEQASLTFTSDSGENKSVRWNVGVRFAFLSRAVTYNGQADNTPKVSIIYNGETLVDGVDYMLTCTDVDVTTGARITVEGIGNYTGSITSTEGSAFDEVFEIVKASNEWIALPSLPSWKYGEYNAEFNKIVAEPRFGNGSEKLYFTLTRDEQKGDPVIRLFHLDADGKAYVVDRDGNEDYNSVLDVLNNLDAGRYYLWAGVNEDTNYNALDSRYTVFQVMKNTNSWESSLKLESWVEGKFSTKINLPSATPRFAEFALDDEGNPILDENENKVLDIKYVVTDLNGKEYYNSETGLNKLAGLKVGDYRLIATIKGCDNYDEFTDSILFKVFAKPGLQWWAILLIVIGALAIAAAVLYILHEKGVLQMITGKAIIAMRTRATLDATIAAVRANKIAEAAKRSVAAAEERDRLEQEKAAEGARLSESEEPQLSEPKQSAGLEKVQLTDTDETQLPEQEQ